MPIVLFFIVGFFAVGRFFWSAVRRAWSEPELRGLVFLTLVVLISGASFYRSNFEPSIDNWTDAIYFAVITLTTIGYGDLSPTTPAAKWFTIFYIFSGLGIIAAFIGMIGEHAQSGEHAPTILAASVEQLRDQSVDQSDS